MMKRNTFAYLFFYAALFGVYIFTVGCKANTDTLSSGTDLEVNEIYKIVPTGIEDVDKMVKKIHTEYKTYVYFNDTISRERSGESLSGEPIYLYNTIDPKWSFSGFLKDKRINYTFIKDPELMLTTLKFIEELLKASPQKLRPRAYLVSKTYETNIPYINIKLPVFSHPLDNDNGGARTTQPEHNEALLQYLTGFQATLFNADYLPDFINDKEKLGQVLESIIFEQVRVNITKLQKELNAFYNYTDKNLYDKFWKDIVSEDKDAPFIRGFSAGILTEKGLEIAQRYMSPEEIQESVSKGRSITGSLGFVAGDKNTGGLFSPASPQEDLKTYVNEIIRWKSKSVFMEKWGAYPAVVEKANMVYIAIENGFGVKL